MIIFLYGPDAYRLKEKLNEMVAEYKEKRKSGLNLKYFEGENLKFEDFWDEMQQASMFKGKKLVILKNIFDNEDFKEKFSADLKKFNQQQDNILICQETKVLAADKLFKALKKYAKAQEFEFLKGIKLKNWVKKEIEKLGGRADANFINKLIDFAGNDSWRLANEIKKLVSFRKKEPLQLRDIDVLVQPEIEVDIFKTIDALAQKDKKTAILLIKKHLEIGEPPLKLFGMIVSQFRNLLQVKEMAEKKYSYSEIIKETKLHPFVVKKSLWGVQRFTMPELKKIYQKLFQVDLAIKTGKAVPETALDLFIAEI